MNSTGQVRSSRCARPPSRTRWRPPCTCTDRRSVATPTCDRARSRRRRYLLLANPGKPLGRYFTDAECDALISWLRESPRRHLLIDSVYDLGAPFAAGTRRLLDTGRAVLLHSVTKGWLWPRTFGVVLLGPAQAELAEAFRADPPAPAQLRLADRLLTEHGDLPRQVADELAARAERLFPRLPDEVLRAIPTASRTSPGNYFFPVDLPAQTLQHEYGVLAIPTGVFGESRWSGSILTSLADAFDVVARR